MFLVRKISRAKWETRGELNEGELSADAVTSDLRTAANSLSFWRCSDEDDVRDAVLALVAGFQRLDKIDVVWIPEHDLREDELSLRSTSGNTPVHELAERHVDVRRLDYVRLGRVAQRVAGAISQQRFRRWRRKEVRDLLLKAVEEKRVRLEELGDKLRDELAASSGSGK